MIKSERKQVNNRITTLQQTHDALFLSLLFLPPPGRVSWRKWRIWQWRGGRFWPVRVCLRMRRTLGCRTWCWRTRWALDLPSVSRTSGKKRRIQRCWRCYSCGNAICIFSVCLEGLEVLLCVGFVHQPQGVLLALITAYTARWSQTGATLYQELIIALAIHLKIKKDKWNGKESGT